MPTEPAFVERRNTFWRGEGFRRGVAGMRVGRFRV
jgi:hypothetical protein